MLGTAGDLFYNISNEVWACWRCRTSGAADPAEDEIDVLQEQLS